MHVLRQNRGVVKTLADRKRNAVITGASGMIGSSVASRLAQAGWRLHLIDIDAQGLEAVARTLPDDTTFQESRLRDSSDCAEALRGAGERIDGLVHMAGIFVDHDLSPDSRSVYDATLQNNATNAYDLVTATLPKMSEGASFVFASSLGFNRGNIDQIAYSMAKGAIVGLTRGLSRRLGPKGVRANAVAPGIIESRMTDALVEARGLDNVLETIPLRRLGQPSDVAGAAAFLLSEEASYITGQVINIDGGIING